MSGLLTSLQESVLQIMQSDPYYARVKLLTEQLGDIRNQIQQALNKLGICALITTPSGDVKYPNAPGPMFDPLTIAVDIVELVLINRGASGSQQPASDVAEHTAWLLHYTNHAHHRNDPFIFSVRRIRLVPDKQFVIYQVEFTTTGLLPGIITEET